MFSARRLASLLILSLSLLAAARLRAQEVQPVTNWPAPPYWMPRAVPAALAKESLPAGLVPEVIEAVPTAPLAFTGITPCRVADTRGNGFSGQYGPPKITPAGRTITITNTCGIPAAAEAVSFNFSAVNVPGAGFLVAYPAGGAFPASATMTYNANTPTLSNAAVVPLGTAGAITVVAGVVSIDLVIDVNGYYAPQTVVNTVNGLSGAVTLAAGSNVSITPAGQTLTIASTAPAGWTLTGNAGTTAGTNFLGTTDDEPFEIKVNGQRVLRLEPSGNAPNVIAGFNGNAVLNGVSATIAGGGIMGSRNTVTDDYGTVGGGIANQAGDLSLMTFATGATVAGGINNTASAFGATVAGGLSNTASATGSTIGGGNTNTASSISATVGGGFSNSASGDSATVPGGAQNAAAGTYSFAAGRRAKANHAGTFVWGDSTAADVASTGVNQFIVRSSGGIWLGTTSSPSIPGTDFLSTSTGAHLTTTGIWTNNSDAASKENFEAIDRHELLEGLAALPMSTWSYKSDNGSIRHIGPMAQDFAAAFGVGNDDRSIGTLDADGVAFAAIQELYEEVQELRKRLAALESAPN
jgi:endosialidase-like protein